MGNVTSGANVPGGSSTAESQAPSTQSTLLQQAQALQRYGDNTPTQQNYPVSPRVAREPRSHVDTGTRLQEQPAYLNPFGERPSREPSPVGRRLDVCNREFTHVRSRSDPVPFVRDNCPVVRAGVPPNVVPGNQGPPPHGNTPQVHSRQDRDNTSNNFPNWNPFSNCNDFVVNTETTDEDFASLREPTLSQRSYHTTVQQKNSNQPPAGAQFVSVNVRYAPPVNCLNVPAAPNSSNSSPFSSNTSSRRNSDSDSDTVQGRPIMHSNKEDNIASNLMHSLSARKNNSLVDAPVNAGCDVDEMTTMFDRRTKAHEQPRSTPGAARQTTTGVFDAVPFRKPVQGGNVARTTRAPFSRPGTDPFGAAPFKQREAAMLVRKQTRKSRKDVREESGGSGEQSRGRRVLPIVPTQARS